MLENVKFTDNINRIFDDVDAGDDFQYGFINALDLIVKYGTDKMTLNIFGNLFKNDDKISFQMKEGATACIDFLEGKSSATEGVLETIISYAIAEYTLGNSNYLMFLNNLEQIKEINIKDDNSAEIVLNTGMIIRFSLLTQFLQNFGSINENDKKELESINRTGKCHIGSILMSQRLEFKNDVVSGYTYSFKDKYKILHSWIELMLGKRETVIDYTLNVVINKEGYKYLTKAEEINRLRHTTIQKDIQSGFFQKMFKTGLGDKEYVFFRDEIERDIKRIDKQIGGDNR